MIQADRLSQSWHDHRMARTDTAIYARWIEAAKPVEQAAFIRAHGRRLTYGHQWRMNADIQAFMNAAAQVFKIVRELGASSYPTAPGGTPINHARNYVEHWEGPESWTVSAVKATLRGLPTEPGSAYEMGHDLWVGGAPLGAVSEWVVSVRNQVAAELTAAGTTVPTERSHVYRVPRSK